MTDALKQARDALVRAEACILVDRTAVMDCHTGPDGIDDEGAAALDDYDDALLTIRAAIARADAAQAAPVGYVNGSALQWLHSPDRGTNAHIQVGIFKTPGEACATPLYAAAPPAPAAQEPEELSPEFTDTARAALLWVLWHHQGGSSPVGQPIRFALGMGAHERLNEHQIAEAKRWAGITKSTTNDFHRAAQQEPAPIEPQGRKPSAQFYIGQNARKAIYLRLAEQIVDGDDDAYSDDYWLPLHDKLTTAMRRLRELEAAQQEPAQAAPFTGAQTAATTLVRVLVEPAQAEPPPDGFELLWVRNLGPLLDALDRAEEKGYLPDAMADQWAAFEFRQAKPAGGAL